MQQLHQTRYPHPTQGKRRRWQRWQAIDSRPQSSHRQASSRAQASHPGRAAPSKAFTSLGRAGRERGCGPAPCSRQDLPPLTRPRQPSSGAETNARGRGDIAQAHAHGCTYTRADTPARTHTCCHTHKHTHVHILPYTPTRLYKDIGTCTQLHTHAPMPIHARAYSHLHAGAGTHARAQAPAAGPQLLPSSRGPAPPPAPARSATSRRRPLTRQRAGRDHVGTRKERGAGPRYGRRAGTNHLRPPRGMERCLTRWVTSGGRGNRS